MVAPQPFLDDRGTPIAVHQVIMALSQLGYAVDILTYPVGRAIDLPGVRLFRLPNPFRVRTVPIGLSGRKLVLDALLVPAVWRHLRSGEYMCVHAVEEAAFPAVVFAQSRSIPVVYDMQSSLPEQMTKYRALRTRAAQAILRRCERWLLRRVDWVISSSGLAPYVRSQAPGVRLKEWSFVGSVPETSEAEVAALRTHLAIPDGAPVVVYTGTFEEYQGLPILLAAIPRIRRAVPGTVFVLVGAPADDPMPAPLERLRQEGAVRVVPRQPRERIHPYLGMADVLVSPRVYGGNIPLKIFDYLAAGRPIVATDLPMHRSVLDDERAVLVPPLPEAFADAIVRVLREPDLAARLGQSGLEYARTHLSWSGFVRSVSEVYRSVHRSDAEGT